MRKFSELKDIKVLVLDIDGVCTNGILYYDYNGNISKAFCAQDGIAIKTAIHFGLDIAIITGRSDKAVEARVKDLDIKHYYFGKSAKLTHLTELKEKLNIDFSQMAYMGDDWIDIDPMRKVGFPIAVANARKELFTEAAYITKRNGGEDAVREVIEYILTAKYSIEELMSLWINE